MLIKINFKIQLLSSILKFKNNKEPIMKLKEIVTFKHSCYTYRYRQPSFLSYAMHRAAEGCAGPGEKLSKGALWRHNFKRGEAVFYNILQCITYYPTLTHAAKDLHYKLSNLESRSFKGLRCFGSLVWVIGPGSKCLPLSRRPC